MNLYTITIRWSDEDQEFVATCPDVQYLQYLSWLAPTRAKALAGFEALLDDVLADLTKDGVQAPPLS